MGGDFLPFLLTIMETHYVLFVILLSRITEPAIHVDIIKPNHSEFSYRCRRISKLRLDGYSKPNLNKRESVFDEQQSSISSFSNQADNMAETDSVQLTHVYNIYIKKMI